MILLIACTHASDTADRGKGGDPSSTLTSLPTGDGSKSASEAADEIVLVQANQLGREIAGGSDLDGDGIAELFVTGSGTHNDGMLLHAGFADVQAYDLVDVDEPHAYTGVGQALGTTDGLLVLSAGGGEARAFHGQVDDALVGDTRYGDTRPVSEFGSHVGVVGDPNGDGVEDVSIAEWASFRTLDPCGSAFVFSSDLRGDLTAETDAWAQVTGVTPRWCLAIEQFSPGDMDGDGRGEYAVSGMGGTTVDHGFVGVFYELSPGTTSANDASAQFEGLEADKAAYASGAGDIDRDGLADLIIGAIQGWPGGIDATGPGEARLWVGTPIGFQGPDDASATLVGEGFGDSFGQDVAGPGDVDGDGSDDVLVGAVGEGRPGGWVYIVHGPFSGTVMMDDPIVTRLDGDATGRIGHAIAALGDVDQDGTGDFAVGVLGTLGGAYVFYGPR